MHIPIKRFDTSLPLPAYTANAAGFDFTCRETTTVQPRGIGAVPLNVVIKVPEGHVMLLFSRSSTPLRKGLMLANGVGVIDPFYCGDNDENYAFFLNITDQAVTVEAGDRVAQGIIIKTEQISWQEVEKMNEVGHGGYQHMDELAKQTKNTSGNA